MIHDHDARPPPPLIAANPAQGAKGPNPTQPTGKPGTPNRRLRAPAQLEKEWGSGHGSMTLFRCVDSWSLVLVPWALGPLPVGLDHVQCMCSCIFVQCIFGDDHGSG